MIIAGSMARAACGNWLARRIMTSCVHSEDGSIALNGGETTSLQSHICFGRSRNDSLN